MLTLFLLCRHVDDLESGEQNGFVKSGSPPLIGQKVSIGGSPRWEVVKVEKFTGASDAVFVAYLNRFDHPLPLEPDWDCNRFAREYGSDNESLAVYVYPDGLGMSFLIDGHQHRVGEILANYERVDGDSSLMRETAPYHQIEAIADYRPEESFYKALHVCQCKAWDGRLSIQDAKAEEFCSLSQEGKEGLCNL